MELESVTLKPLGLKALVEVTVQLVGGSGRGKAKHGQATMLFPVLTEAVVKTDLAFGQTEGRSCRGKHEGCGQEQSDKGMQHGLGAGAAWRAPFVVHHGRTERRVI